MNICVLGRGKTGSLVASVAEHRGHTVRVLHAESNAKAAGLTPESLQEVDVVVDFTAPHAVLPNIEACVNCGKNMVVGTTGWYDEFPKVRRMVEERGTGFVYAANFSVGVNLFFEVARTAAAALEHQYFGQIFERHHAQKKDAPSGTAIALQKAIASASGTELEITSFREGEVVGLHELTLDSPNDTIYLCHDAKSRRGFADGAVRAAEWLVGKRGFFDFKDVWKQLP
jgi:4-hydroxy-tetrahydrodipicolinate reductase